MKENIELATVSVTEIAYARHKVIYENDKPIDYLYLDVSKSFEKYTGLKPELLIGNRVTEVIPNIRQDSMDWVDFYGKIAKIKQEKNLVQYSAVLEEYYNIHVISEGDGIFVTLFNTNSGGINSEAGQLKRIELLNEILKNPKDTVEEILDQYMNASIDLTESKIGYLYFYNKENEQFVLNNWSNDVMKECNILEKRTTYDLHKTGIWGEVVRQKRSIVVNEYQEFHPLKKGYPEGHAPLSRWMSVPIWDSGEIVGVLGLANKETHYDSIDIAQIDILLKNVWNLVKIKRKEEELSRNHNLLKITIDSIGDGIISLDETGIITNINEQAIHLLQLEDKDYLNSHYSMLLVEHAKLKHELDMIIATKTRRDSNMFQEYKPNMETELYVNVRYFLMKDKRELSSGVILVVNDVTDYVLKRKETEYLRDHDALTGLYNRKYAEDYINELDVSHTVPTSVIFCDLNGLKLTNDVFGHVEGDRLIKNASSHLQKFKEKGAIARWGGDEFVLVLPNVDEDEVIEIVKSIKNVTSQGKEKVSIAIGYSVKKDTDIALFEVIKEAEKKMYQTKIIESEKYKEYVVDLVKTRLFENSDENEEHANAVRMFSIAIGKRIGLNKDEIGLLAQAAYLHDLGKIGVETTILEKPGSLTKKELDIVQKHSEIGYQISRSVPELSPISNYILYHHEWWNGEGYPRQLQGAEIPLFSRIISVADAYVSMLSKRYYRDIMTKEETLAELKRYKGIQFDPKIVDKLLEHLEEK